MSKTYKLSQLIIDNENPYYRDEERLKNDKDKKIKKVCNNGIVRHLTWIDNAKDIKSVKTPDGKELTPEELFDFVIGNNVTDFAKIKNKDDKSVDIAIVLGNGLLETTRERAIKACELYKLGLVKKIIFTGGLVGDRGKKSILNFKSIRTYKSNKLLEGQEWNDCTEADWGAETLIKEQFDEDYQKHTSKLTDEFLQSVGIKPEDVLIEALSTTTQENAEFCKNIFDQEEIETGEEIKTAVLVTTCTHGNRAMRQFKKVFGDKIELKWCPSTLDLEKHEILRNILRNPNFDEEAFRQELKRIYCTDPKLTQMLREEIGHNRNVFIRGEIDEPDIVTSDIEKASNIEDNIR